MHRDLLVFGEDWGAHPSSTQHLVSRLARDRRVLWVNSLGLRRPRLSRADLQRLARKGIALANARGQARNAAAPFPVMAPAAIPWPGRFAALNGRWLARQLRSRIAQQQIERPLLWTSLPTAFPVIDRLAHGPVVYYCGDDFSALAGVDHGAVCALEARLAARADLIVVASDALTARFPAGKTAVLPHGVDHQRFATPVARARDLPAGCVAGFYGTLADWVDVDALVAAAKALPSWTFVFIGPVATDVAALERLPNVRLLGARPHGDLPGYAQHWTVSLLPFRQCAQIEACNPLKLREYLAAGTPIVAASFPALAPYRDLVHEVRPGVPLAPAILAAAQDTARNAARTASVASESWEGRATALSIMLDALS
jgi:glycosyltransferase involved in cell wall biosynthesis